MAQVSCSDCWSAWSATVHNQVYSLVRIIAIRSRPGSAADKQAVNRTGRQ
jgi:hypothetical protein